LSATFQVGHMASALLGWLLLQDSSVFTLSRSLMVRHQS